MGIFHWTFFISRTRKSSMNQSENHFSAALFHYFPFCLIFLKKIEQNGEYGAFRARSAISFVILLIKNSQTSNDGSSLDIYAEKHL